jgi:membrane protein YqaA with SNARE-associated domain
MLLARGWSLLGLSFLIGAGSGVVPLFSVEAYLVGLAVVAPPEALIPALLLTTAGHVAAKYVLYLAGSGAVSLRLVQARAGGLRELRDRLQRKTAGTAAVVLASATTGLPPFYLVSLAAGSLRWPPALFLLFGGAGRLARFATLVVVARHLSGAAR